MSAFPDRCPLCDFAPESWAVWDWHRQVDHLRDDEPCELCGEWDEPTEQTTFGWAHSGCATQRGYDLAAAEMERREEGAA